MRSSVMGPYGLVQKSNILLIIPQNSDVSSVPEDVTISYMQSFTFHGNDLIWLKKPVQQTKEEKAKATVK